MKPQNENAIFWTTVILSKKSSFFGGVSEPRLRAKVVAIIDLEQKSILIGLTKTKMNSQS